MTGRVRFSVLLPTRNGGAYLRDVIASALGQSCDDFELVVSDNASDDGTRQLVAAFASDPRLRYTRLEKPVPVTENWTNALRESRGDYFLMLGDDDAVLPGALGRLNEVIRRNGEPECVTYNGFSFVFPGSVPDGPHGYYADPHFVFGPEFDGEKELSLALRHALVRDMYHFRVRFPLNMQLTLVSRRAAERVRGGVFRPPFPDHYALNALLLETSRFMYIPDRLVVVGVSPKSFGHYFYSDRQEEGVRYLGLSSDFAGKMPGSELLNSMCVWLMLLRTEYSEHLGCTEINRRSYAGRQAYHWFRQFEFGRLPLTEIARRSRALSVLEWASFIPALFLHRGALRLLRGAGLLERNRLEDAWRRLHPLSGVNSMAEFVRWATESREAVARQPAPLGVA